MVSIPMKPSCLDVVVSKQTLHSNANEKRVVCIMQAALF